VSSEEVKRRIRAALRARATAVDLSGLQMRYMPAEVDALARLEGLQSLSLSDNKLDYVPKVVFSLVSLRKLDLSHNNIQSLSRRIAALEKLEELSLRGNSLQTLVPEIGELKKLAILDLRGTPIPVPPDILARITEPSEILNAYSQASSSENRKPASPYR